MLYEVITTIIEKCKLQFVAFQRSILDAAHFVDFLNSQFLAFFVTAAVVAIFSCTGIVTGNVNNLIFLINTVCCRLV